MNVNRGEVKVVMGPQFYETGYGRAFFQSQLPNLIKALNRLAEAVEKQNELKQEEKKNDQSEN